jgi:hypothetical protein
MNRRGLRLELVAGLGIALAMPAWSVAVANAQDVPTQTTLTVNSSEVAGHTHTNAIVTVKNESGAPASGIVVIEDGTQQLASMALNSSGQADMPLDLAGGDHSLRAVYQGDTKLQSSVSRAQTTSTSTASLPDFQVSVTPLQPSSLNPGESGTALVTITPINDAALANPMFITISCSQLPNQAECSFTPSSVEILPNTPTSCPTNSPAAACPPTSSMVLQTQAPGTATRLVMPSRPGKPPVSPIAWAFLFPGVFGLGGLAWGTRRRRWLSRVLMLAAVGILTSLGTTACNPQWWYYNQGQPTNPPTPAGTYTVKVTAQSSNGITAITHSTTLAMKVN